MTRPSRILLLHDGPAMLDLIRTAIHHAGWNAHLSAGAPDAQPLDLLRRCHLAGTTPDLVLLSCPSAGAACLDTVRIIRSYPGCRFQPIIVLAALMPFTAIIEAFWSFHVLAVIEKPAEPAACATMVRRLMSHFAGAGQVTPRGSWISGRLTAATASARLLQL